jgi:hypothetical protein
MAWPGNEKEAVAAGCGHLRASHADREQMIGTLKAAFVQGRLTKDEFDTRIGQAFTSRTYAELAAVSAGIPAGPAAAQSPRESPRRQMSDAVRWGTSGLFMPAVLAGAFALASLGGDGRYEAMGLVIAFVYFVLWLSAGAELLWQWHCACSPQRECVSGARTPPPLTAHERPAQSDQVRLPRGDAVRVQAMFRQGYHHRPPTWIA